MRYKGHDGFIQAKKFNGKKWFFCDSHNGGVDMYKKDPNCHDRDAYLYHGEARDLACAHNWAEKNSYVFQGAI